MLEDNALLTGIFAANNGSRLLHPLAFGRTTLEGRWAWVLLANGGGDGGKRGGSRGDVLFILMLYFLALGGTALEGRWAWVLLTNGGSDAGGRRWSLVVSIFALIIFPLVVIILGHPVAHAKIVGIAVDTLILGLVGRSKTALSALLNVSALHDDRLGTREVTFSRDEANLEVLVALIMFEDVTKAAFVLSPDNGSSNWTGAPMLVPVAAAVWGKFGQLLISFFDSVGTQCCPPLKISSRYPPTDLLGLGKRFDARGIGKVNSPGSNGTPSKLALTCAQNGFSRPREWIRKNPWIILVL